MTIKPIKSETDYKTALERLQYIFDADLNTPEGDKLKIQSILIKKYENVHFPIDLPYPIEALKFRIEPMGYTLNYLVKVIGLKSRVSEILNKKRKLSLNMIRKLHHQLQIPTEVLIQAY